MAGKDHAHPKHPSHKAGSCLISLICFKAQGNRQLKVHCQFAYYYAKPQERGLRCNPKPPVADPLVLLRGCAYKAKQHTPPWQWVDFILSRIPSGFISTLQQLSWQMSQIQAQSCFSCPAAIQISVCRNVFRSRVCSETAWLQQDEYGHKVMGRHPRKISSSEIFFKNLMFVVQTFGLDIRNSLKETTNWAS